MKKRRLTVDVDYLARSYGANDSYILDLEYDDYGKPILVVKWVEK